jgi:hypothetical protein
MKIASWIFITVGFGGILFGLASCQHYYAVNPPPEAFKPGWDADAHIEPYVAFIRFWVSVVAGFYFVRFGKFLGTRTQTPKQSYHPDAQK